MALVHYRHGMIHKRPGTQWEGYTNMVWYTMGRVHKHGMVHNGTGTQDWYGTQWDWYATGMIWYTIGLVHNGTGTLWAWYDTQ